MAQTVSEIINVKPTKALAMSYLIFGYVMATTIVASPTLTLTLEEKIAAALAIGGILSTVLYYLTPVEQITGLILRAFNKNLYTIRFVGNSYDFHRTDLIKSPFLRSELARVYGAFFFSISIAFSGNILTTIGLNVPFWALIITSIAILTVGLWECYVLGAKRTKDVAWYYLAIQRNWDDHKEIGNAVNRKDWSEVNSIVNKMLRLGGDGGYKGVCNKCWRTQGFGVFCEICGNSLQRQCPNCGHTLVNSDTVVPKYCIVCGNQI